MKVKALISFVGYDKDRKKYRLSEGEEIALPAGVDWLKKGLVEEVKSRVAESQGRKVADKSEVADKSKKKATP